MQLDPSDRVYLNRPCYGSATLNDACAPRFWTGARYSETVIAAMDQALDALVQQLRAQQLVLIGHSGGGSIAMLLAQRREDVVGVITLAANLDHRMWTDSFEYLPLSGSLNASEVVLPSSTLRWHFAGARDRQVPAAQTVAAAKRDPHARVELIAEFDHHCCWARRWPAILRQLQTALADTAAAVFTAKEQNKTPRLHDPLRAPASSPAPVQYR